MYFIGLADEEEEGAHAVSGAKLGQRHDDGWRYVGSVTGLGWDRLSNLPRPP